MKKISSLVCAILMLTAFAAAPLTARAEVENRLYDFTDEFYRKNGVDPAKIIGRRQGVAPTNS